MKRFKVDIKNKNLAINGGPKVRTKIWKDNFTTGKEEISAAKRVIKSGYLSLFEGSHKPDYPFSFNGGPEVQLLEQEWSKYYGVKYSIAVNSATSGLFAAIAALNLGFGDEVIVSPFTMTACAMAPMIYGAIPVFADVESDTGCLDPVSIESKISKKTKAILVVHQFGFVADMKKIIRLSRKYNLKIIEDCAQAHGAKWNGKNVGLFGDIGVFSLNVNKTIQSGEGGICVTNNYKTAYRLKLIRNHGEAVVGPANYRDITNIAGYNYRMTELSAAIAREQLKKLGKLNVVRLKMVKKLKKLLTKYKFLKLMERRECKSCKCTKNKKCINTYYVFPIRFIKDNININRKKFTKIMKDEGIIFYEGYTKPLYLQPVYQKKKLFKYGYPFTAKENMDSQQNYDRGSCPVAEEMYLNEILINEHVRYPHTLTDVIDIEKAIAKLLKYN